jgi:hypothetical protein
MAHAKCLSAKAVEDIPISSDSEEDFCSDNDSESIENDSQCESHSESEAQDKLPKRSVDSTTAQKKQKVEEWMWKPSCSSPDKLTQKPFRGVPGININVTGHLSEEVRPVHLFDMFVETDVWLYLVTQVNRMLGVQECRMMVCPRIMMWRVSGLTLG